MRPAGSSRQATTWRTLPSTTAPANQLGSRRKLMAMSPSVGVSASTARSPASSSGEARSNRYRLTSRLPFRESGAQAQPLPAVDVKVRLQVQAEVDAQHQRTA